MAEKLTPKQQRFVDAYVGEANCNATRAAKFAGYSERTARQAGSENLSKPVIQAAIQARFAQVAMSKSEVLTRLTDQARGTHSEFVGDDGQVDLKALKAAGYGHLIKKISRDSQGSLVVEFYDAQRALELLGKHHKLFVDKVEHSFLQRLAEDVQGMTDDELLAALRAPGSGDPEAPGAGGGPA